MLRERKTLPGVKHQEVREYVPKAIFGNLRLWSVQELVSRYDFGQSKTYTVKQ